VNCGEVLKLDDATAEMTTIERSIFPFFSDNVSETLTAKSGKKKQPTVFSV